MTNKMNNIAQANADIRNEVERAEVKLWQIAARLGIHHSTLSVWLRFEMSDERKAAIREAIAKIQEERG